MQGSVMTLQTIKAFCVDGLCAGHEASRFAPCHSYHHWTNNPFTSLHTVAP